MFSTSSKEKRKYQVSFDFFVLTRGFSRTSSSEELSAISSGTS
jgi:hypothetical protein